MREQLKETFDQIHAEEALKEKTKAFLAQQMQNDSAADRRVGQKKIGRWQRLAATAACLLFVWIGGYWLYFMPTAEISIDINPSIELRINRFDKVLAVESYNDDGKELADTLNVKYMDYLEAVSQIMGNEYIESLLAGDEILEIAVVGEEGEQCARILENIETCTESHSNAHCYFAESETVEGAHHAGLSYGRYAAYLELQALDPEVTVEEVQNMTMKEIQDRICELSGDCEDSAAPENGEGSCDDDAAQQGNAADDCTDGTQQGKMTGDDADSIQTESVTDGKNSAGSAQTESTTAGDSCDDAASDEHGHGHHSGS